MVPSVIVSCRPLTESSLPRSKVTVANPVPVLTTRSPLTARQRQAPEAPGSDAPAWPPDRPRRGLAGLALLAPALAIALAPAPSTAQLTATSSNRECLRMNDMCGETSLVVGPSR